MKPLFVPLKTEYYTDFKKGKKKIEFRLYGRGINERTCIPGRQIVLSIGYGKHERMKGVIKSFEVKHATLLGAKERKAIKKCYDTLDVQVACITVDYLHMEMVNGVRQLSLF